MRAHLQTPLIGSIGVALVLTLLSYLINGWVNKPEGLRFIYNALDMIQLPAFFVGVLVSGNVHMPNVFAAYAALFLTFFLLVGCVAALVMIMLGWKNRDD